MTETIQPIAENPSLTVEKVESLSHADMNDLCDSTIAAINSGGGFGWVKEPPRETLERYWHGVMVMPSRILFIARLDTVICGTVQLILQPPNNEAQRFSAQISTHFVAPWARGYGLAKKLVEKAEGTALEKEYSVINLDIRETQNAAIKLYETMGYKKFGTHPFYAKVDNKIIRGIYYYKVINDEFFKQSL